MSVRVSYLDVAVHFYNVNRQLNQMEYVSLVVVSTVSVAGFILAFRISSYLGKQLLDRYVATTAY